ncbi:MAG: efflux transporter outer membrane subunit [Sedimentisphaerales bacterium]|jgi:NodT family efflux transporter outer membrane factor (OMF) lipoprotein|nr:efflux transporter outer membrane subunit [Sedimentisphaerales bacterium]
MTGRCGIIGLAFGLLILMAGCMRVGPDYRPPKIDTPSDWSIRLDGTAEPNMLERWWMLFDDPILFQLIERARANNLDLRQAMARVRQARAQLLIAKGALLPTMGASGSARRTRTKIDDMDARTSSLYSVGLDASWELDIFGGNRRAIEAAVATYQARQESLKDVLVSLCAEVGLNYIDLRLNQQLLAITESNLQTRMQTYQITSWRLEAGLTTELDVEQARLSLEQARAQIPSIQVNIRQTMHRIAVLVAEQPSALDEILASPRPVPSAPAALAAGLPADLLRRRPDVRAAERNLAAQTAQIGVVKASLYPSLSLMGGAALESISIGDLLDGTRTIQGALNSAWTIFDAGAIRQNVEIQKARQQEALASYQAAVLAALRDVEDALVTYTNEQDHTSSLELAAGSAQRAFELALDQYNSGLVGFQTVLDMQQSLLTIQEQLARSKANITSSLISLYKALGGGWSQTDGESDGQHSD